MKRSTIRWVVVALILAALPGQSRVFWRWGGREDSARALQSLGAALAYSAPVQINGGAGKLAVYAFDQPFGPTMAQVGRALDVSFGDLASQSMIVRTIDTSTGILRLVAIAAHDITRTLIFAIEQTKAEARQSEAPPQSAALSHLPDFPGSTPLLVAADRLAQAEISIATSLATPQAVNGYYRDTLMATGWAPALPESKNGSGGGIYLRDRSLCYVQASASGDRTHIALFYKQLSIKPNP